MPSARFEPELVALRKLAQELASRRKERVTTAHLLAAISARASAASDLLNERKLTEEVLLRAARAATDDFEDPIPRALELAREIAARMGAPDPNAAHVLVALLSEPRGAARRALEQSGTDIGRLRSAAIHLGQGLIGRRRTPARGAERRDAVAAPRRASTAVSVPLMVAPRPPQRVAQPSEGATSEPPSARSTPKSAKSSTASPVPIMVVPTPPPASLPPEAPAPMAPSSPRRVPVGAERFELDPQRFPTLSALGRNLTLAAARGELDPVVGRHGEVERTLDVLAKREGNNPCLVGAAGVGKTSVVRGLAQRICDADDVVALDDRIVVEIPVTELLAGTGVRGALATRVGAIRREVLASQGRIVLFFDEIQQLFSGDAAEELASDLKLAFARGELPCIGATTRDDFKKSIENDPALARRFTLVEVEEPSREDAFLILEAISERLAAHHRVEYSEDALALGVGWSVRYLPGRALPDKAVSIVDLAGARTRRRGGLRVTVQAVAEVVAELADMPIERLLETDGERMLRLEEILAERVVGHAAQIGKIARILRRNAAGLGSRRPIGTFLLLGPTGVGKTETAKAIAEVLFHNESAMTRLDLSEYSESHAVARLIGAPPGYVGHEAGGQLTEAVRRRPYQVLLLDEIEKAHPDVLTSFLAVFDEGRMTDGRGRTIDFTNTVILMTSNVGSDETGSSTKRRVGFGAEDGAARADLERRVVSAARAALAPELYNRIDEVLVFAPLDRSEVREIARRLLRGVGQALELQRGVRFEFDEATIEHLLDAGGFDPTLGARPMKRTVARLIEAPLAEKILRGEIGRGDVALLSVESGELAFDILDATAARSGTAAE
jgi:ATP-dependent Clp protease ATP-binding subunit ClpC